MSRCDVAEDIRDHVDPAVQGVLDRGSALLSDLQGVDKLMLAGAPLALHRRVIADLVTTLHQQAARVVQLEEAQR